MKLASLTGGRDGRLVVVSRDLERMLSAATAAPTLQAALDDWSVVAPLLSALSNRLDAGEGEPFRPADCVSPLPRAHQWVDGSAYVNHVELVRRARGAELPPSFWTDPLMYQGGSDSFLAPHAGIPLRDPQWGLDLEAEVAVVTDDVALGAGPAAAAPRDKAGKGEHRGRRRGVGLPVQVGGSSSGGEGRRGGSGCCCR